ncbi:DUF1835 domain-containing protein [Christiangramia portivictoriae]|uniref:DUF1835 domain-containing protein n=1 Tax=Christiangramia portivictoriae TaxID=326069 RepID=UPI00047CAF8E|nr:DUF1835 domain-containing protein [Christiangramia portivictoriae]
MSKRTLHIVNGDGLAEQMQKLNLPGELIIWRELLCEGPTSRKLNDKFFNIRKKFLFETYAITEENYEARFIAEVERLKSMQDYDSVYLWFEYDLFCHINMLAAIQVLANKKMDMPVYLVSSKKLKADKEFQPLCQLSTSELRNHYEKSIALTTEDIEIALLVWELYCSDDPLKLKAQIKTKSNFEYLSSCIRAHIERFPDSSTGINSLEKNILKLIESRAITSRNHLLGYALQHQGYYGYSDSQMQQILDRLSLFFSEKENKIQLTEKGLQVLSGKKNFYRELANDQVYGGVRKFDFLYDPELNRLLKL